MVKLTAELIVRSSSGYTKRNRNETVFHYLRRLTHVFLERKSIDDIGDELGNCENLSVLYLYDNCLTAVPHLPRNTRLASLYLQNNYIHRMDNMVSLKRLTKLYLAGNEIARVEGLTGLVQLQELYVENQKLPIGDELTFEPESLKAVANTLQVLDVSGNNLTDLTQFETLTQLVQFNANHNNITEITQLVHLLGSSWRKLARLDLTTNPLCRLRRYRDRIITMSQSLEVLDGKDITDIERQFLKNWRAARSLSMKQIEAAPPSEPVEQQQQQQQLVPSTSFILRQRFYYDTATESVREWQTPRSLVRPSVIQLPELPGDIIPKVLSRSVSNPCYRSLISSRELKAGDNRFLSCAGVACYEKPKRSLSYHVG